MPMILIADSGSTKTDWRLINGKDISQYSSQGMNPVYKSEEELINIIQSELLIDLTIDVSNIKEVHFYGAGCMHFEKADVIKRILSKLFISSTIHVASDMLASARATSFNKEGIVAILGTGANICAYNGSGIEETRSGLGFILGDEGSGAHLGLTLIKKCLNEELSRDLINKIYTRFDLTKSLIIESTYRKANPNLFYAQFSKVIFQLKNNPEIQTIIIDCFRAFFKTHVIRFENFESKKLHITGSVAFYFGDYIRKIAQEFNVSIGTIIEKPIAGLTLYHQGEE